MKVSFFETGRYVPPPGTPREWPVPSSAYDPEIGAGAYRAMVDRARLVEELGFDWISLSEHHYSPRILTPAPMTVRSPTTTSRTCNCLCRTCCPRCKTKRLTVPGRSSRW